MFRRLRVRSMTQSRWALWPSWFLAPPAILRLITQAYCPFLNHSLKHTYHCPPSPAVGACPHSTICCHICPSGVIAFLVPVLMGLVGLSSGGVLDRFANLNGAFLEAGCQCVYFVFERLDHPASRTGNHLSKCPS